jgi:hypothetical protein
LLDYADPCLVCVRCVCRVLVYVDAVAAAYNLLQLCRCSVSALSQGNFKGSYRYLSWACFVLDQVHLFPHGLAECWLDIQNPTQRSKRLTEYHWHCHFNNSTNNFIEKGQILLNYMTIIKSGARIFFCCSKLLNKYINIF